MKRGALNFLGRKNQSLYDTNIKIKDMDNVELVLDSPVNFESGTASVRARPTVKHHSSSDSFQGFAVPTPKVPLLPPVKGPQVNGSVGAARLSNGSLISVPDLVEGEIFVPPPPSMAPPPPPDIFIPPPPDFMGYLTPGPDLANGQSLPMTAQKPSPSMEVDIPSLKPPTMSPPKPPSTCSSSTASYSTISSPPPASVPDHPKFAPPQPPLEKQQKTHKTPPPKPVRLSSISILDSPPQTPAPPPPVKTPTLSSFNPQNKAKLYSARKASVLSGYEDSDTRPKQMLLLEESGSANTPPVLVHVDGKVPKVATSSNSVSKDVQELKENVQMTEPSQPLLPEPNKEATTVAVSAQPEVAKTSQTPPQISTQAEKVNSTQLNLEPSRDRLEGPWSQSRKFSPLLDRKLRNLKGTEPNGAREGHAASPLALLKAAKEREKQKSTHVLSQENPKNEQQTASIQPMHPSPDPAIPKSRSSSSLIPQERIQETPKSVSPVEQTMQTPQIGNQVTPTTPAQITAAASLIATNAVEKHISEQSPSKSQLMQPNGNTEMVVLPFLPPPPEFEDLDFMEPPPSIRPPDPPLKKATPTPPVSLPPPAPVSTPPVSLPPPPPVLTPPVSLPPPPPQVLTPPVSLPPPAPVPKSIVAPPAPPPVPPPSAKPKTQASTKLSPPESDVKAKPQMQTKTQLAPNQLPPTLSQSQATLLSILQKKMLEMDHKMAPATEAEASCDDWNGPLSDEEKKVPFLPKAEPKSKNNAVVNKAATLDMRELEGKVKKNQMTPSVKVPASNGPSKQQYGMTFTVRPGTKQPITVVNKGES